jgi:hypothetical protein
VCAEGSWQWANLVAVERGLGMKDFKKIDKKIRDINFILYPL